MRTPPILTVNVRDRVWCPHRAATEYFMGCCAEEVEFCCQWSYWQQNRSWTVTKQLKEEGVNILGCAKVQILHHFVIAQQAKSL